MKIPAEFREDADAFPPKLRALLDAELAAGNEIQEVGHSFPAPPAGAYFKMSGPFRSRERQSGDGLVFWDYNSSIYSGSFTDDRRFYHLLEPPLPPPPEPDMDAIRAAHNPPYSPPAPKRVGVDPSSALARFERSMEIDYEKWHDGIGYDLDALREATPEERNAIAMLLVSRGAGDWRDVEALAELKTLQTDEALRAASESSDPQIRLAVTRHAPHLVPADQRTRSLVQALQTAVIYGGLTQALDEAAEYHPKEVVEALFQGALKREGEVAVHCAALLMFVHGKAAEPFEWKQRPFFLRFHTEDRNEREQVFRELCRKVGVEASDYL